MPRTAIEQWTMEAINAVLPDGTPEQKQALACVMIQGRAKELRTVATDLQLRNAGNQTVQAIALKLIDREHKLERIGLKWAAPRGWPPGEGSTSELEPTGLVSLQ